jgi:hypothetical protein
MAHCAQPLISDTAVGLLAAVALAAIIGKALS